MKIRINETGEMKDLTIIGANGIEWTSDLLGNHDATNYNTETEEHEMNQEDFDWWQEYIENHDEDEQQIEALAEELGIEENEIRDRINEEMNCELGDEHQIKQNVMEEIKKENGGNEMTNLLNEKYGNALEIIEETGKLAMASIDDGDLGQLQEELKALGFESYIDTSTDYLIVEAGEEKRIMELIEKEFLTVEEMEELTNSAYVENWEHNGNSGAYNGYNWYVITVENEDYSVYEKSEF